MGLFIHSGIKIIINSRIQIQMKEGGGEGGRGEGRGGLGGRIHQSPVDSPHKGPVRRSYDVYFDQTLE